MPVGTYYTKNDYEISKIAFVANNYQLNTAIRGTGKNARICHEIANRLVSIFFLPQLPVILAFKNVHIGMQDVNNKLFNFTVS